MAHEWDTFEGRVLIMSGLPIPLVPASGASTQSCPSHLFNMTCDVYRPSTTADAQHAAVDTYALHLSTVPCRVNVKSGSEPDMYGRITTVTQHSVYVSSAFDIVATDRIVVDGRTLDVIAVVKFDLNGLVRLDCMES